MSEILWFALLIPFILAGVLLGIPKLRKLTKWWELVIPIVATVITVLICQYVAISSAMLIYFIVFVVNIAAGLFVIFNPWHDNKHYSKNYRNSYRPG